MLQAVIQRESSTISLYLPELMCFAITSEDRRNKRNSHRLKKLLNEFVEERKSGRLPSYTNGQTDLMTIMLENEFYKDDSDLIVNELLTFWLAGMKTVQLSSSNTICYLDIYPEVKKKLLAEIEPVVAAAKDNIVEKLDFETVMDFEYLHQVFYESLRIEPPL